MTFSSSNIYVKYIKSLYKKRNDSNQYFKFLLKNLEKKVKGNLKSSTFFRSMTQKAFFLSLDLTMCIHTRRFEGESRSLQIRGHKSDPQTAVWEKNDYILSSHSRLTIKQVHS